MGSKKLVLIALILCGFLYAVSMINAEIILSQPDSSYNLGDELVVNIKLDALQTGYIDVNLVCANGQANLYHNVPETTSLTIKRKLTSTYIGNLSGQCNIVSNYAENSKLTRSFQIDNKLELTLQTEEISITAGESIKIKGTVYKKNNQLVGQIQEAFIETSLNENISTINKVKDSQFDFDFLVPTNTHAGVYSLKILAYDKDGEEILNSAESSIRLTVKQKPARVSIALDKTSVIPGENITIMAFVYDMAGDDINNSLVLKIQDSSSKNIYQKIAVASEMIIFQTGLNNLPGLATVVAESGNISAEKAFQIEELQKIAATINDGKLILSNVGNIPYSGPIEVQIGEEKFVEILNLEYGKNKTFDISAPDGLYSIAVKDSSEVFSQSGVSLTGSVINLRESGAKISDYVANNPIVWVFIVAVILLFVFVLYKKHYQNKKLYGSFGKPDKKKILDLRKKGGIEVVNPSKVMERIIGGEEVRKAEQMTILHGQKQEASIIAIKIKKDIGGISQDTIDKALEYGYKQKAVSYSQGDNIVLIFSPLVTKTGKNEESAIKVALDIDTFLKEHNRKFRNDKIDYGIGVNSGEIVNRLNGKILQFANINKTIKIAKKVAELANDEVLLSKEMHEKTASSVKTEKVASGAMDLYSVKRVINTEETKKFMNEFMKRSAVN